MSVTSVDLEAILQSLTARIAERRAAGEYPEGLEQQLESEFTAMLRAIERHEIDTAHLDELVAALGEATHAVHSEAASTSRVPGGALIHEMTGRVVRRHTDDLAATVRTFGWTVHAALNETRRLFEAQRSADERQLLDALSGVLDRLAVLDHLVEIARDLESRVSALESSASSKS
jgi:hypothetical protein